MRPKDKAGSVKERLIIEGFGGIRHLELDLNRIVLLTGPQAEGKSLCAKLLHFFKSYITLELRLDNEFHMLHEANQAEIAGEFVKRFPSIAWGDNSFRITFLCDGREFSIERQSDSLDLCNVKIDPNWEEWLSKTRFLWFTPEHIIPYPLEFAQLFIPAERISLPSFKQNAFRLREKIGIDPFLEEFGGMYENAIEFLDRYSKQFGGPLDGLPSYAYELLSGELSLHGNRAFVKHNDGREVPLENASSGQKQLAPLLVVLKRALISQDDTAGYTLYPEEPEANLFPEAQRAMVQLLTHVYHKARHDIQLIIATHSPYILSTFNNLLEAGIVQRKFPDKLEQIKTLVPEDCILDPSDLTAYSIGPEGAVSLMDPETGLISADKLDSVSESLSENFGKLLELEYE